MKRFITLVTAVAALCTGLVISTPAEAGNEWGRPIPTSVVTTEQVDKIPCDKAKMCKVAAGPIVDHVAVAKPQGWEWGTDGWEWGTPDTIDTAGNGYAMGVLPNYWTLCVANGYGPTVGGPVLSWNYPGRALTISLRNVCDGYSVTNRMTIDNINNSGACIQYTRLNNTAPTKYQHWGPYYYIWNNNPVIWINTRSGCNGAGGQLEHNAAKGVGYILGLAYSTCSGASACVMGPDNNGTYRATNADSLDANTIYQTP